ncbi:MAG: molybdopterin-dependent oxidoreductase, partial [Ilumatobacteraceae bacterium]
THGMTIPDDPFSSDDSRNPVQLSPVGALPAKTYRFKARPWDLEEVESTCTTCAVGCRTVVQSSRDEVVRVQGVDVDAVNWGWLCDRGRFNFESVNSEERLTQPLVRDAAGSHVAVSWSQAMDTVSRAMRTALAGSSESVAIIGGARGTNEDAFAWASLADALGVDQRDAQLADGLPPEVFALPQATIDEVASSTTTILLAPDLKDELPVLYLRLRHAAEHRTTRIVELASCSAGGLTNHAWRSVLVEPGMFASAIRGGALAGEIADQLAKGSVSIVVGRPNLAESADSVMSALSELMHLAPHAKVLPVLRRGNVRGAITAGLTPRNGAGDTAEILRRGAAGKLDVLVLLGSDPASDFPDADLARRALASTKMVVSIDAFMSKSAQAAHVVLPAAVQSEKSGTTTNIEGRISTVNQKVTAAGTSRPDWMIALELASACGKDLGMHSFAEVQRTMIEHVAEFAAMNDTAALAKDGVLAVRAHEVALARTEFEGAQRNSYQFRLLAYRNLYDSAVSTVMSTSLRGLASGSTVVVHPLELPRSGGHVGDHVMVTSPHGSITTPIATDERVMRGTAWIRFNQPGADVRELIDVDADVVDVKIERVS